MSQKEFQRVKVIANAVDGRLRVSEAAGLLQLSERQVQRLKRRYRPDSIAWVHHGDRGRPTPWALPAALRQTVLGPARGKYAGFNDSHLCEKLHSEEHLSVSRETVRRILRAAKLASPQKRRARQYRAIPSHSLTCGCCAPKMVADGASSFVDRADRFALPRD